MAATTIDERRTTMSKIILLDVDGTLVDYDNNLPDSAVEGHPRGLEFYLESNNGLFASEGFEEARSTPSASIPPARARRTSIA